MQYIFGPVPSRRLGFSAGVDLVPYKTCSYNCPYCELGKTTSRTKKRASFFPLVGILKELRDFLANQKFELDFLTFSGSGEPTLNTEIGEVIGFLKKVTDIPVAVLTNGSLLFLPEVRKNLALADLVIPSLDAASTEIFKKINRPAAGLEIGKIIEGLKTFSRDFKGQLWLEVLFCQGFNDSEEEVHKIARVASEIRTDKIQLGTVARPPADSRVQPVPKEKLFEFLRFFGPKAEVIGTFQPKPQKMDESEEKIVSILGRRPSSAGELSRALKMKRGALAKILEKLEREGKIIRLKFEQNDYFQAKF